MYFTQNIFGEVFDYHFVESYNRIAESNKTCYRYIDRILHQCITQRHSSFDTKKGEIKYHKSLDISYMNKLFNHVIGSYYR